MFQKGKNRSSVCGMGAGGGGRRAVKNLQWWPASNVNHVTDNSQFRQTLAKMFAFWERTLSVPPPHYFPLTPLAKLFPLSCYSLPCFISKTWRQAHFIINRQLFTQQCSCTHTASKINTETHVQDKKLHHRNKEARKAGKITMWKKTHLNIQRQRLA
jgi:hypothetical protein